MSVDIPRNVVVVIGLGGIGLAAARRLGSGRRLVLADVSEQLLQAGSEALRLEGHIVETHSVNVVDRTAVEKLAQAAAAAGRVETILHTAGVSLYNATARQILEVDLLGTAHVIHAFLPVVSPGTSLVCIASSAGYALAPPAADLEKHLALAPTEELLDHPELDPEKIGVGGAYLLAKRGNHLRVQASVRAWGEKGARLNSISPGIVSTTMGRSEMAGENGKIIQMMIDMSGSRRIATPDDVAGVAAFLAGPDSYKISGTDILLDGGESAGLKWHAGFPG